MKKVLNAYIIILYYMIVVLMPVCWISLTGSGSVSVKPMHVPIVFSMLCFCFLSFRKNFIELIYQYKTFVILFMLLMFLNFLATTVSPEVNWSYIGKNTVYFFCFLVFGAMCSLFIQSEKFTIHLTISNTICVLFFIAIASILFKLAGGNFLEDLVTFFFQGNSNGLRYTLYKTLFNAHSSSDEAELPANLLNTLIGSFIFVHFTSLFAYFNVKGFFYKALNVFNILFSLFFTVSSISRSNIIAIIFGYLVYWLCDIFFNRNNKRVIQLIAFGISAITLLLIFWTKIEDTLSNASTMIAGRFSDMSGDERWQLNAEAGAGFISDAKSFFVGHGSGAELSNGQTVHNFVLGSAYQAGILGLVVSATVYLFLLTSLIRYYKVFQLYKNGYIICALMSIPLIRAMESAGAGSLTLQEWFCVSFFFSFIAVTSKKKKSEPVNASMQLKPVYA